MEPAYYCPGCDIEIESSWQHNGTCTTCKSRVVSAAERRKTLDLGRRVEELESVVGKLRAEPLRLKPGDILALETEEHLPRQAIEAIKQMASQVVPEGCKVVVLERLHPRIIRAEEV